jgi:hypothetical protein
MGSGTEHDVSFRTVSHVFSRRGYVRYPAWSPQNDRIVFEHATVTANIWTARLTGGAPRAQ